MVRVVLSVSPGTSCPVSTIEYSRPSLLPMQMVACGDFAVDAEEPRSAPSCDVSTSPLIFQHGVPLALPSLGSDGLRSEVSATPSPLVGSKSVAKLANESSSSHEPVSGF